MSEEIDSLRMVAHAAADLFNFKDGRSFAELMRVLKRDTVSLQKIAPEFKR